MILVLGQPWLRVQQRYPTEPLVIREGVYPAIR
jgi:hypothetical protein